MEYDEARAYLKKAKYYFNIIKSKNANNKAIKKTLPFIYLSEADISYSTDNYENAIFSYKQALHSLQSLPQKYAQFVIAAEAGLCASYIDYGYSLTGLYICEEGIKKYKNYDGLNVSSFMHILSVFYAEKEEFHKAETYMLNAISEVQNLFPNSINEADMQYELGWIYAMGGKKFKALETLENAFNSYKKILGDNHPYLDQISKEIEELRHYG